MKEVKQVITENKDKILQYMVKNKIERLTGIKNNTQYIDCLQKQMKCRPTQEQMMAKLVEMFAEKITDPALILQAINTCGGTKTEHRISRRTRRINAAKATASSTGLAKETVAHREKKKKLKLTMAPRKK
jgi:hypothetical protein